MKALPFLVLIIIFGFSCNFNSKAPENTQESTQAKVETAVKKWIKKHYNTSDYKLLDISIVDTTAKTNSLKTSISALHKIIEEHRTHGMDTTDMEAFLQEKQQLLDSLIKYPERSISSINFKQRFIIGNAKPDSVYIHINMAGDSISVADKRLKEWHTIDL